MTKAKGFFSRLQIPFGEVKKWSFYERSKSGKFSSCRFADYDDHYVFLDFYVHQQNTKQ